MVSANEISPGQEGQITVSVKAGSSRRQLRQTVQVQTNIPGNEQFTLTITANVLVDLEALAPNILRFEDRQSRPQVIVKNYTDTPVEIVNVVPPNDDLTLTTSATVIPPQGDIVVTAELASDTPNGVISAWAELHTNLASQPVVYLRVWANLENPAAP